MSTPDDNLKPKKEEPDVPKLEPIDGVITNMRAQGKDKFMIAAELKQMR